ncbi:MAG: sulfite exporter TauE/SafE family protein [Haloarculaceae archaeon]
MAQLSGVVVGSFDGSLPASLGASAISAAVHGGFGTPADVELVVFFLVGLLGGAHCLGMCGPLVTMYSKQLGTSDDRRSALTFYEIRQHALFNLGRTVSYAVIGGLFGLLGALLYESVTVVRIGNGVRAAMGILVGVGILAVGVRYLLGETGGHLAFGGSVFGRVYGALTERVESWVNGPGIVGLGMVHGLLPCPLLYPAFLYAFARGSPAVGAIALGTLGLGTFPTLFLYGTLLGSVDATHRARLHRALGVAFLLLGWIPLAHGLSLAGLPVPHVPVPIYQPLR